MSAISIACVLLAAAVLTAPAAPLRRLSAAGGLRLDARLPATVAAGVAAVLVPPMVTLAGAILAGLLVVRRRRRLRDRRCRAEGRSLADALEILAGELRVGAQPVRAFAAAAAEAEHPIAGSLRAVAARARLGADVVGGLQAMAATSAVPGHWNRLAVCWQLAAEHGLAMSTLVRAAQRDIVERHRFAARVDAGLAGARATAGILAGLPVLGVVLGELIGAHPIGFLLGSGVGGALLVTGVALVCIGLAWSDRITDRMRA